MKRIGFAKTSADAKVAYEPSLFEINAEHPTPLELPNSSSDWIVLHKVNETVRMGGPKTKMPSTQSIEEAASVKATSKTSQRGTVDTGVSQDGNLGLGRVGTNPDATAIAIAVNSLNTRMRGTLPSTNRINNQTLLFQEGIRSQQQNQPLMHQLDQQATNLTLQALQGSSIHENNRQQATPANLLLLQLFRNRSHNTAALVPQTQQNTPTQDINALPQQMTPIRAINALSSLALAPPIQVNVGGFSPFVQQNNISVANVLQHALADAETLAMPAASLSNANPGIMPDHQIGPNNPLRYFQQQLQQASANSIIQLLHYRAQAQQQANDASSVPRSALQSLAQQNMFQPLLPAHRTVPNPSTSWRQTSNQVPSYEVIMALLANANAQQN